MYSGHVIVGVEKHSIAHKLHIKKGDKLISVNGEQIRDIFDYQFLIADEMIDLVIEKAGGKRVTYEFEKDMGQDIGLQFDSSLMDEYRSCTNKCIFCFIDQNPPGMRDTIYFKDDDSRLSFLQGNYVTLTNMKEADIDRIIRYRMEPINISVHTTEPDLRCMMLNNRFAGDVLRYLDKLNDAGILMNGQIVMCKGVNDREHLEKTLRDLAGYIPNMQSVSVVPVGLTKYREGLYPLEPIGKEDALETIRIIEKIQKEVFAEHGIHFCHASDEFYITAGLDLPEEERYDGYLQIENGVGMIRSLTEEFRLALDAAAAEGLTFPERHVSVAVGKSAEKYIRTLADEYMEHFGSRIDVRTIRNDFYGESITVTGLLCGCDVIAQLEGKDLGEELLISVNMLRAGEMYLLDDVTVDEIADKLKTKVVCVPQSGEALFRAFAGLENTDFRRQIYEADSGDSWTA
ncbi:MAG: DUF512 domain-containing protein [Lachnospiraceae bacterium]|nr:DUF512 domain-containing protein [Lachnospiraceae bacterium]